MPTTTQMAVVIAGRSWPWTAEDPEPLREDDRRSVWVRFTPAGRDTFETAKPTHRAILREYAG